MCGAYPVASTRIVTAGSFGESSVKAPLLFVVVDASGARSAFAEMNRARRASADSNEYTDTFAPMSGCPSRVMTDPVIDAKAGSAMMSTARAAKKRARMEKLLLLSKRTTTRLV